MLNQAIPNQLFDTLTHQIQVATDTMNNILAGDYSFDTLLSLFSQLSSIDFTAFLLKEGILLKLKGSDITEPAHKAIPNPVFDTLTHQIQIATDMLNSVLAGNHRFDALPSLSSQLGAIEATATALRLAVLPSEMSETQADGDTAKDDEQRLQHTGDKEGSLTAPVISSKMQQDLLSVTSAQVVATGHALACVLDRLPGDTLAGRLAGRPNKKALDDLLGDIYEQIGVINKLVGLMMFANKRLAGTLCETSRAYIENLCREAIENTGKSGGEK
jgi:hypothetical protein